MVKLLTACFCFLAMVGLTQPILGSSISEDTKKQPLIKKVYKDLKGKVVSKKAPSPPKVEPGEPSAQDILAVLKAKGILSKSSVISKVLNTEGTAQSAKQIIFVSDDNHRPYVIKRFKTHEAFLAENEAIEKVNQDIIPKIKEVEAYLGWDYKLKNKFPTITSGKAYPDIDKIGIVVLETGVGNTLYDSFIEKLSTIEDKKISEVFTSIGEQWGNLDKAFYKRFKMILLHNDASSRNFTYDDFTKTLYWIDTAEMTLTDKQWREKDKKRVTGVADLLFLEQISGSKERYEQLVEWFSTAKKLQENEKVANASLLSAASRKKLEDALKKITTARAKDKLAIESFRKGYVSMNPDQEADCNASIKEIMEALDAGAVNKKLDEALALQSSFVKSAPPAASSIS